MSSFYSYLFFSETSKMKGKSDCSHKNIIEYHLNLFIMVVRDSNVLF